MADVNVTGEHHSRWGTHSYGEERLIAESDGQPSQMTWADIHPPDLVILPKGSPAAGVGEINWEDTLGGKFALALKRLEGLLYAVFGSRPAKYKKEGLPGYWTVQWYDRLRPRCLWGPEIWERQCTNYGQTGCTSLGNCEQYPCYDFKATNKEYASLGQVPSCCPFPKPSVPIRSQSGDPRVQIKRAHLDKYYFPPGSLVREHGEGFPFDPEGYGWFGATQPGRDDAATNPWLDTDNGYTYYNGESVDITWEQPPIMSGFEITAATVFYQLKPPGGSWGSSLSVAMAQDSGDNTWCATIAAQQHGTQCRWYLRFTIDGPGPVDELRYAPGGLLPPDDDDMFTFSWYTHYNQPHAYGLPELLDDYGGVDTRHGTDYYEFDGSETIQPELINMARFVLSWLGYDCCGGDYSICRETEYRSGPIHHNPRYRQNLEVDSEYSGDGLCCVPMPVKFRWSGSNQHPHYVTGGKGDGSDGLDTHPLLNTDDADGDPSARKTWRGINPLFRDQFDNPSFGGGYSWGVVPGTFTVLYEPLLNAIDVDVYATWWEWGLREGDVIEAVHIQEIIDAVQYLIDYGIWTSVPVCTTKMTPGTYLGFECGYDYSEYESGDGGVGSAYGYEYTICDCNKCCENAESAGCYTNIASLYCETIGDDCLLLPSGWECIGPYSSDNGNDPCDVWTKPTWVDDRDSDCTNTKCDLSASKRGISESSSSSCNESWSVAVKCDYDDLDLCGTHQDNRVCVCDDGMGGTETCTINAVSCGRTSGGSSYYMMTPDACYYGWDDYHGNPFIKQRVDHDFPFNIVATGPPGYEGSGNCLGDIFACGTLVEPEDSGDVGVWFHEVVGIRFNGLADNWFHLDCNSAPPCGHPDCGWSEGTVLALPYGIPGYGLYDDADDPICSQYVQKPFSSSYPQESLVDGHYCECAVGDYPVCQGEEVWVAVDLQLDGSAYPYVHFHGQNGEGTSYTGDDCVPYLTPYDLTLDVGWMHDCPCETDGEDTCE